MAFDPPPPHFWKIMLQFFYNGYGCIYEERNEGQIVWNACTCLLQGGSCFDFSQYNCWKNIPWTLDLLFLYRFHAQKALFKVPKYLVLILLTIITNIITIIISQNEYLVSILCKVDPPFPSPSHESSPHLSHPSIFPLSLTFKQSLLNIPPCFPLSLVVTFSHFLNLFPFHWISAFHFTLPRTRRSLKEKCVEHIYSSESEVVFELRFCLLRFRLSVYFCFGWGLVDILRLDVECGCECIDVFIEVHSRLILGLWV